MVVVARSNEFAWTEDLPTVEGWYWRMYPTMVDPGIVEIWIGKDGPYILGSDERPLREYTARWLYAGPIPMPATGPDAIISHAVDISGAILPPGARIASGNPKDVTLRNSIILGAPDFLDNERIMTVLPGWKETESDLVAVFDEQRRLVAARGKEHD